MRERITTAVTYARNRDIRRRHSLSIGACGSSCSVDKHLDKPSKRTGGTMCNSVAQRSWPWALHGYCAWARGCLARASGGPKLPACIFDQPGAHSHPAHANVDERHHARKVLKAW